MQIWALSKIFIFSLSLFSIHLHAQEVASTELQTLDDGQSPAPSLREGAAATEEINWNELFPVDGHRFESEENEKQVLFAWKSIRGASSYLLELSKSRDFLYSTRTIKTLMPVYSAITQIEGSFFWRVHAVSSSEVTLWTSSPRSFSILTVKGTDPPALSKKKFVVESGKDLVLRWTEIAETASYYIEITNLEDKWISNVTSKAPFLRWPYEKEGTYFVRVRAINEFGKEGPFSSYSIVSVRSIPLPQAVAREDWPRQSSLWLRTGFVFFHFDETVSKTFNSSFSDTSFPSIGLEMDYRFTSALALKGYLQLFQMKFNDQLNRLEKKEFTASQAGLDIYWWGISGKKERGGYSKSWSPILGVRKSSSPFITVRPDGSPAPTKLQEWQAGAGVAIELEKKDWKYDASLKVWYTFSSNHGEERLGVSPFLSLSADLGARLRLESNGWIGGGLAMEWSKKKFYYDLPGITEDGQFSFFTIMPTMKAGLDF